MNLNFSEYINISRN